MPRKKKSKVDIIAAYVAENPDATWSTAESVLASKGISGSYFASQRSKLKANGGEGVAVAEPDAAGGVVRADKAKPGKRGRKPKNAAAASSNLGLAAAVEFARKAGGIDKAQALLSDLARVQL